MVQPSSSERNHAWLPGCGRDTEFFVWHTSGYHRTMSSASLLPIVSMMQPAHPQQ